MAEDRRFDPIADGASAARQARTLRDVIESTNRTNMKLRTALARMQDPALVPQIGQFPIFDPDRVMAGVQFPETVGGRAAFVRSLQGRHLAHSQAAVNLIEALQSAGPQAPSLIQEFLRQFPLVPNEKFFTPAR